MAKSYGKEEYLDIAYIYNLNKKVPYLYNVSFYQKTMKGKGKTIGQRCKPEPEGKPGYLRVDTMTGEARALPRVVYHINQHRSCFQAHN